VIEDEVTRRVGPRYRPASEEGCLRWGQQPGYVVFAPGAESGLSLFTPPGHEDRIGEFQPISFWCDDVFATAHILKSKGVTFAQEPKTEVWGSLAVFKDPDGNQFVLSSNGKRS